jgi:hypothetical protein
MNLYKDEDTCEIKEGNWEENRYDEYKFGEYWSNEVYMRDLFSSVNQYLRLSGMQQERDLLQKLSMRFVHTSNKDVSLINNSRVPN